MPTRSAWPALITCSAVPTSRIRWPTSVGSPVAARIREADGIGHAVRTGGVLDVLAAGAVGDAEVVDATRRCQVLGDAHAVVEVHPSGDLLLGAEPDAEREAVRHHGTTDLDDPAQEAHPVVERAAVRVGAAVGQRREELRRQVAVRSMDLGAVEPGLDQVLGRDPPALDDLVDLADGELVRRVGVPHRLHRRRGHRRRLRLAADELSSQVHQLPDQPRPVPVDDVGLGCHRRHDLVEVPLDQLAGAQRRRRVHDAGPADDQADPTGGQALEVLDVAVGRHAALDQAGACGEGDEPVPQVEPAESERRVDVRERVIGHRDP